MKLYIPTYMKNDKIRIGDLTALMTIANYEKKINNHTIYYDCSDPMHKSLNADILFNNTIESSNTATNQQKLLDNKNLWVRAPHLLEQYGNKIIPILNFQDNLYNGIKIPDEDFIVFSTLIHPEYNFHRKMEILFINSLIKELEQNFKNVFIITDDKESIQTKSATIINTDCLYDIVYLISKAKVFIGGDTGFTHFSALARVPNIISIYGENFIKSGELKNILFNCMPLIDDDTTNHFSFILEQNKLSPKQIEQLINITKEQLNSDEINTVSVIEKYIDIGHNKYAVKLLYKLIENGNETYKIWHLFAKASLEVNKDLTMSAFKRCMELEPSNKNIFIDLASYYLFYKEYNDSIAILQSILQDNPNNAEAYMILGYNQVKLKNNLLAFEYLKKAYELSNKNPEIINSLATIVQELGDNEIAKELFIESIDTDKNNASAYFHLALVELLLGNYEAGWEHYEWRYNMTSKSRMRTMPVPMPFYKGEDLKDKKIFIYHEQGFGDTIQFIRYIKILQKREAIIVILVQPPLEKLLKENFSDITFISKVEDSYDCDFHLSMMSLPFALQIDEPIEEIPLSIKKKTNKNILKNKFNVGIVWQGNTEHINDHNRSIKPSQLSKLSELKNIQLYSLQKDATNKEQKEISNNIIDLVRKSKDFYDTAQVVQELDLVITIDSAMAHLSASLGIKTWLLLPHNPDWRWGVKGDTTPWYDNVILFRKTQEQTWEDIVNIIYNKLSEY